MRLESFGDGIDAELERHGYVESLRLQKLGKFHILDRDRVSAWLHVEEAKAGEREEVRSEESLSISRKALSNSERATRIAISAIVFTIIMAIYEIIKWYSK